MLASKKISIEEDASSLQNGENGSDEKNVAPVREKPVLQQPEKVTVVGYAYMLSFVC